MTKERLVQIIGEIAQASLEHQRTVEIDKKTNHVNYFLRIANTDLGVLLDVIEVNTREKKATIIQDGKRYVCEGPYTGTEFPVNELAVFNEIANVRFEVYDEDTKREIYERVLSNLEKIKQRKLAR